MNSTDEIAKLLNKVRALELQKQELLEMLREVIAAGTEDWNVVEKANHLIKRMDAAGKSA
jgi:hypothetical protein